MWGYAGGSRDEIPPNRKVRSTPKPRGIPKFAAVDVPPVKRWGYLQAATGRYPRMARRKTVEVDKLNVSKIKALKPRAKDYKVSDGRGLYLLVTKGGGKLWRFKYRYGGKERLLTLGRSPT